MLVQIKDRKYSSFSYNPPFEIDAPHPFLHKLFHNDEIIYSEKENKIEIKTLLRDLSNI